MFPLQVIALIVSLNKQSTKSIIIVIVNVKLEIVIVPIDRFN